MEPRRTFDAQVLRRAEPADTPGLVRLVNLAYQGDPEGDVPASWTHEADIVFGPRVTPAAVLARIAAPDAAFLLLERPASEAPRELAGCVYIERRGAAGYIGLLSVHPRLQGARLGTRLLRGAEAWVQDSLGLAEAVVWVVSAREELAGWYERAGYRRTAETHPFPADEARAPGLFFVVMRKGLASPAKNAG